MDTKDTEVLIKDSVNLRIGIFRKLKNDKEIERLIKLVRDLNFKIYYLYHNIHSWEVLSEKEL